MGAYYSNTLAGFLKESTNLILGTLTHQAGIAGFHQQLHTQTLSWGEEIDLLKFSFKTLIEAKPESGEFGILLEYPIARREKRIDAVIIADTLIIVIEFKVGKFDYLNADKEQLLDYCLDLRDFHFESREKVIVPILLATNGDEIDNRSLESSDLVKNILFANAANLKDNLIKIFDSYLIYDQNLDLKKWDNSDYSPTPTIIEAAQTLYAGKSVVEISRSHAGTKNLTKTSNAVINAIKIAKANNQKIICFITGVPGAGKTLAGLNIAHDKDFQDHEKSLATFLSGNGPLIKVLREALSRDAFKNPEKRYDG